MCLVSIPTQDTLIQASVETTLPLLFNTKYEILIGLSYNELITNNTMLTYVEEHTEEIKPTWTISGCPISFTFEHGLFIWTSDNNCSSN